MSCIHAITQWPGLDTRKTEIVICALNMPEVSTKRVLSQSFYEENSPSKDIYKLTILISRSHLEATQRCIFNSRFGRVDLQQSSSELSADQKDIRIVYHSSPGKCTNWSFTLHFESFFRVQQGLSCLKSKRWGAYAQLVKKPISVPSAPLALLPSPPPACTPSSRCASLSSSPCSRTLSTGLEHYTQIAPLPAAI